MKMDIGLLVTWVIVPPIVLLLINGNFFISCLLYLVLPSIYFSIRVPTMIFQSLLVATMTMLPMIIFDYLAFLNKTWAVSSIFSIRFFEFIPIEDFFFTFWAVYVVIMGFNYFFPKLIINKININHLKNAINIILFFFGLFLIFYFINSKLMVVSYYYFWLVLIVFLLPTIILFVLYPDYRKPVLFIVGYTLFLMLPYEIVANMLGFWSFPSIEYLGMVHLFGQIFPVEEFVAWMILFPLAVLAFRKFSISRN